MKRDRTTAYAKLVVSGKKIAGRKEFLACKRHLDDLKRKKFDYKFDVEEAEFAIDFANTLVMKNGEPLKTRGFQEFIIGSLHGWRKKRTKERRFREAYIQVGRRNGKSFLSGMQATFFSTYLGLKDRIFCAATKQDQANIVWDDVRNFIESDSDLTELYKVKEHDRTIKSLITDTVIKSLGRDTKSMDGFGNILSICDELHAHPNNQMYKLLLDGQADVDNALTLAITTAGFNLNSFCYEHYQFCEKILEGLVEKETLFIFICEMDKDDDIWDWKNWLKANPYFLFNEDGTPNQTKIARYSEKVIDAKEKGGDDLTNFLTKQLNMWVTAKVGQYIDLAKFKECESDLTLEDMQGRKAYLGFDLSKGGDLTSIALVFRLENDKIYIYSHSFMPELRLEEHEKTDDVPYRIWVREGLLTLTTGAFGIKTDYKFIISHLKEILEKYEIEIVECGYDAHNAGSFLADLDFLGCDLTEVKQSAKSLNDTTVDFALSVKATQVLYDKKNSLLKWSIANATTTSNSFGEIKVDKQAQKNRIDPVDAILDAWKIMLLNKKEDVDINESVADWLELMG
ncbi:putative phage terminase, large subunit [Fusobacterium necrophorum subsp. funduliforme ATCC 51357]|uniref:terminase large subunit n=1 Tax=Fusobacterium necrophorum TaxID=859 RepID=UPI00025E6589|nr:terminase TerL endonuclease subunit [Fusobacterium necrophorum]EIJ71126.1 putative phage terminase, large subunit [Fusobacterium necrophorum subsp. funduliforme ATCC 51357]KAB0552206.1 terminase large subunit [Fusobacterium necrophorum subsp. funduliforme]KYM52859.1 terminase [Fusobacterium necrophorum subsp. funduliforme]KYM59805.1 terminase [Fusobacterium necrophorum subsp. funduliforme]